MRVASPPAPAGGLVRFRAVTSGGLVPEEGCPMKCRGWGRIVTGVAVAVVFVMLGLGAYARWAHGAKVGRAKSDMQTIEQAVKKYYTEHGEWPPNNNLQTIAPYLECGRDGSLDPWGGRF